MPATVNDASTAPHRIRPAVSLPVTEGRGGDAVMPDFDRFMGHGLLCYCA